ncbi:MAG: hypothetical protein JXR94_06585 [Candidatus Hydrogenedentes bacterium]|nr:hypothetical protein [Candidatus Hydrogenedentota bacterium]
MAASRETLEAQLNDFDPGTRRAALEVLADLAREGRIELPEPGRQVNMHCHTFFSFNGYGYSPSCLAWKARCAGLAAAGVVDFDVLDAVDEFLDACRVLDLRGCAGIETRVYLEPFATREINSPGEPGITYHMGAGFPTSTAGDPVMADRLRQIARGRNLGMLERVNAHLAPLELDYDRDVTPLTPSGNATERHVCVAYDRKSQDMFPDDAERARFWADKLGVDAAKVRSTLDDPPVFHGLIRSKLMKAGGVGYVKPAGPDFPRLEEVNAFSLDAGAIPTLTWLDGFSEGEQAIDELLDVMLGAGAAALNIVPDRNWNIPDPELRAAKVAKLHEIVAIAESRGLPILVGTEMNAYGQRFVDDFDAPEMAPLVEPALNGAYLMYAHTMMQSRLGMGYLSSWARTHFDSARNKNDFFVRLGKTLAPSHANALDRLGPEVAPEQILVEVSG